jgi:alpha-1,6-mannosyltransferase
MKLCDLALYSPDATSGVRTYISSKIAYVGQRRDVDHVVLVPGSHPGVRLDQRSKVITVPGLKSPYPGLRIGVNIPAIAAIIEREAPDVIELNCQYSLPWAAFLATRRSRAPIVGVYHTDVPACARHWARHAGAAIAAGVEQVVEWYERLIYRHCTATVILNPAMRDRVERLRPRRIECLPCGVDTDMFHPRQRDDDFRRRLGIAPGQIALIYAGRLSPEKELDVLWDAFARLPQSEYALIIAGGGPESEAVAARASASQNVTYLGDIASRPDLARALASSDVFVIPGRYETFGMATLEALSSGVPVVGIRESGTATVVPSELGMLTHAGDAAGLADAIAQMAAWEREPMRQACHAFAAKSYAWEHVFDRYFVLYRELVAARSLADPQKDGALA